MKLLSITLIYNWYYYYIGLGIWGIILTVEYFKLQLIDSNISDILELTPLVIIVLFCLLPIKRIWEKD